ncbi:holo-[acyl-carrier-protein] synthase [Ktedonosporobacter rubrisoli]|uniref:Holo-[acyl-carrier-protein] synthase n=1 Tax=Ktedonosporobacter rubrisoli TaxID=2509675 RepID=A0A4P6JVY6_KTERU|nr:holo-ACP synthase [Ktedonosporobacter rubrisoli]QBD79837.1 holo-[acyl-carrier-protein] synthase [Ktedonosporobacter rubrisoli]
MDQDQPLLFTPLVRAPGVEIPDWLFGPAGAAGLPAPLSPPQGVNVAVGVDIIEVERIRRAYERHGERFLRRIFTEREILQCRGKPARWAGRFAAKEAMSKALGTGLRGVNWREMEIVQLYSGRPSVRLHGKARWRAEQLGLSAFDVSIADLAQFSIAIAVALQTDRGKENTKTQQAEQGQAGKE